MRNPWYPPRGKPEKKAVFSPHGGDETTTSYNRAKKYRPTADMFILLALSWDVAASYPQYGKNTGFFSNFPLMGSTIVALYRLLPWNFKE